MPEKGWACFRSYPMILFVFKVLTFSAFCGIFFFWGFDGFGSGGSLQNEFMENELALNETTTTTQPEEVQMGDSGRPVLSPLQENLAVSGANLSNQVVGFENLPTIFPPPPPPILQEKHPPKKDVLDWVSTDLPPDYSSFLVSRWLQPGGVPCKDAKSVQISIPELDIDGEIELSTGEIHEFAFQALDNAGVPLCLGGDYFEIDLSGKEWKSRPPINDLGNGTYSFSLQVHDEFPGDYKLTIILLYRHFEGLRFASHKFAFDTKLRIIPLKFNKKTQAKLPEIKTCTGKDFGRDIWSGRWTRLAENKSCKIDWGGRYRCLDPNLPCRGQWCSGAMGNLESNGWIYSAHCSFRIFSDKSAWDCISGRWLFFWGDSNHCDTIRNMLNFVLGVTEIKNVTRKFDEKIVNPHNSSQFVRITNIFNGHHDHWNNYLGLESLQNENYREMLKAYFSGETVPDSLVMNSGLHDGVHWKSLRQFVGGASYAADFWAGVLKSVRDRGLRPPRVIYRSTVATAGYARSLQFNPSKMEAFNGVLLWELRRRKVVDMVVDHFDMTFPWHYDNRANDGVHYGRAPANARWRDGIIGHEYFVDLMLCHVLLNVVCAS